MNAAALSLSIPLAMRDLCVSPLVLSNAGGGPAVRAMKKFVTTKCRFACNHATFTRCWLSVVRRNMSGSEIPIVYK